MLLSFSFLVNLVFAQGIIQDKIYKKNIKTAILHKAGDEISFPVIELKSSNKLILSFDDLDADIKSYSYTISYCNSDWTVSDLHQSEYIDGYFENQMDEYQSSFNTTVNYTHYTLTFPNENIKPKLSGNYILKIFENNDTSQKVITKRFTVVEQMVLIESSVRNTGQSGYFYNDQELEIKLDFSGTELYNPGSNTKLVILKNYNWEENIVVLKPDMIRESEIIYDNYNILKFNGGNEFYYFNTKSIEYHVENIQSIDFIDNMYHFLLAPNTDRTFKDYIYEPEINGRFKIDISGRTDPTTEADYAYVYFTLKMDVPLQTGDIFVWGALTNYEFSNESKMVYSFEEKAYECRLFLKQGYYNYQYVLVDKGKPDYTYIEGNHAQTENDYIILVYYHDFRGNCDRLIGVNEINSVIK